MRDGLVTFVIFALLPMCFLHPWKGLLVYSWIGYMSPHHLTFGFAYNIPFAMIVAVTTIAGMLFTKDRFSLVISRELVLLLALWGTFVLSTQDAIYPDEAWKQLDKVTKIFAAMILTTILIQDQEKIRALLWVIVLSIGFYGVKGGAFAILTGGNYKVLGPPDSFLEGNTNLGLALNMVIPLVLALREEEKRPQRRHILLAAFLLCALASLMTYSRGAFLGLAVSMGLFILKGRARAIILPLIIVGALVAPYVLPEQWFGRMETIQTYQQESSAVSRLRAWEMSYNLAMDRPLLGGGFEPFSEETYRKYLPEEKLRTAIVGTGAHSIFFQVLAEHGFVGLFFFVALLVSTALTLNKTIQLSKLNPSLQWIHNYAQMIQISLAGYAVSGFFLSMCYFDLYYQLVAIAVVLRRLCQVKPISLVESAGPHGAFRRDIATVAG